MSPILRRLVRVPVLLWAIYLMFAQPGLPACWLEAVPCEFHVHFSAEQAETPHSHNYLLDQALGQTAARPLDSQMPAASLLFLLAMAGLLGWNSRPAARLPGDDWPGLLEPPPPKTISLPFRILFRQRFVITCQSPL
jgi:hypothetical protein